MITYIDDNDVKNNLPVKECVDELKEAFISYGKGESDSSPRDRIYGKDFVFSTMPALYEKRGIAGLKTYMYGKSGYRFFVILFSTENPGKLFAMDANVLGQIRTGEEKEYFSKKGFHIAGSYGLNKIYALDIARTSLEVFNNSFLRYDDISSEYFPYNICIFMCSKCPAIYNYV